MKNKEFLEKTFELMQYEKTSPYQYFNEPSTAIMVPYSMDTKQRFQNTFLTLLYIFKKFENTDVFLIEMDDRDNPNEIKEFIEEKKLSGSNNFSYIKINKKFKKTELVNYFINNFSDHYYYFFLWDSDILLTDDQIKTSLNIICDNLYGHNSYYPIDAIIPYNGTYNEIRRYSLFKNYVMDFTKFIENKLKTNFNYFDIYKRFKEYEYIGTGGCAIFNMNSIFSCGGMNEDFVKWGYEDDEIVYRMQALGKNVIRLNNSGPIHHMEHSVLKEGGFGHDHNHEESPRQRNFLIQSKQLIFII